jgi:ActR/RegA family two-component response regulator
MRAFEERVKLTMDYMNSPAGIQNWFANAMRGYDRRKNILAAVQTVTRLIAWERIKEVYEAVEARLLNGRAA